MFCFSRLVLHATVGIQLWASDMVLPKEKSLVVENPWWLLLDTEIMTCTAEGTLHACSSDLPPSFILHHSYPRDGTKTFLTVKRAGIFFIVFFVCLWICSLSFRPCILYPWQKDLFPCRDWVKYCTNRCQKISLQVLYLVLEEYQFPCQILTSKIRHVQSSFPALF